MVAGIGSLIGGGIATLLISKFNVRVLVSSALFFFAICVFGEALSIWIPVTATLRFLTGVCATFLGSIIIMLVMNQTDQNRIGKVSGFLTQTFVGGTLIGILVSGPFLARSSILVVYGVSALTILIAAIFSIKIKQAPSNS
ncbi:hypothetical protein [Thermoflavimicrobium dichotomicum]|uniref:Major facilitator superfamily (MFS) profile domain-containing protein n=1 Tax=Thermoflavimicrobium dichotomicum TaxID=46223 RepID=A0A1I3MQF0_9BACL|nr:hypothetical protein [Thermoflavimicrobium dichotomicum]SFI99354.1 hypothetical protein SAMN05421852_103165 [Thermoflavimicrobium dichotomicum]